MVSDASHLDECLEDYIELADVELLVEGTRLPAHSQILAMHSKFVRGLLLDTGPRSWQDPVVIESCLEGHSLVVVKVFLTAAYRQGSLTFPSVQVAWQVCLLVDHLDCPKMLQQCQEHLSGIMDSAQLSTSKEALEWILTADKLGLDNLKELCAQRIASDYDTLQQEPHLQQLPAAILLVIMRHMSVTGHRHVLSKCKCKTKK